LVGYQGSVDALLEAAAGTGAALSRLNLQHSQVTDAGLAVAAAAFPKLAVLYLCYCRCDLQCVAFTGSSCISLRSCAFRACPWQKCGCVKECCASAACMLQLLTS
jgi:hypothetical protein